MAHVYTPAKAKFLSADLDLNGHDIRVMLCMTNTTADTDQDAGTLSAITTLDEMNGANYARIALTTEAVVEDAANNRGEFTADNVTWTALGNGTRALNGALVYRHVDGTAANDVPIAWIDSGGINGLNPAGADLTIQWNATDGIIAAT